MSFQTLKDFDFSGKTVLVRADLNVPTNEKKQVTDFTRIDRLKPTIDALAADGAKILILSHFGRPKGEVKPEYSLDFLAPVLADRWGCEVTFSGDSIGECARELTENIQPGTCGLLENLRFHSEEERNDEGFAKSLAALGDVYINDAFSVSHRAHASTEGLARLLPSGAGLLMEAELKALQAALEDPEHPVMAIVGGAKVSTKLSVLHNLVKKVDMLVLGGGMANTFLAAKGYDVGKSLCEMEMLDEARQVMDVAAQNDCEILLPVDCAVASEFKENAAHDICKADQVPADKMILDAGPDTARLLSEKMSSCKTVLWNGPLGVFEMKPFDYATNKVAVQAGALTKASVLKTVAGGGDTVAALENAGVADDFSYISTAGGAFLEWLEGKELPGVAALLR
jgi:phosphoglycerate kinase